MTIKLQSKQNISQNLIINLILRNQLEQYLNLRESQHHLRDMSQQRQLLASMSRSGREQSDTTMSIGTFLRPREEEKGSSQLSSLKLGTEKTYIFY